jgi:hypothetical protein
VGASSTDPGAAAGATGRATDGKSVGAVAPHAVAGAALVALVGTCLSKLMTRSGRSRASSSDGRRDPSGAAIVLLNASALDGFAVRAVALVAAAIGCAAGVSAVDGSAVVALGARGCAAGVTAVDGSANVTRGASGCGAGDGRCGGGGGEICAGSPNSVFVTPGAVAMGLPLLGQTRRLGSCSCPQWLHLLTTLPVTSLAPISLRCDGQQRPNRFRKAGI